MPLGSKEGEGEFEVCRKTAQLRHLDNDVSWTSFLYRVSHYYIYNKISPFLLICNPRLCLSVVRILLNCVLKSGSSKLNTFLTFRSNCEMYEAGGGKL